MANPSFKTAIVIPARLQSTRLPRKLLLDETGKTLIEHTYFAARQSQLADQVIVATDSHEIFKAVEAFGGQPMMTNVEHRSGTDRIAEVAGQIDAEFIVNVQGDEPEISGDCIDKVFRRLKNADQPVIATLATPVISAQDLADLSCVKVVFDRFGKALYFSRGPIPMARDSAFVAEYFSNSNSDRETVYFQHVGIYGYHRQFLEKISDLLPTAAEQIESLEQLRFLGHGWPVYVDVIQHRASGIDTLEDYALFVNRQRSG